MFMDSMKKQIYQCAQYKLKNYNKTWQQKHSGDYLFVKKYKSGYQFRWHAISVL